MTDSVQKLRRTLFAGDIIAAPGAVDALGARVIEKAGFGAAYMTGLGATASRLGMPDLGLMTQTEMADHARAMCRVVDIPVIADADTGYGGALNIRRAVADYVQAGVAALHLEDQVSPKRCGQLAGIKTVSYEEAINRFRAAMAAREEYGDIAVIARTDALSANGLEAALERAKRYADLGVDLVFVDGVKHIAEVEGIAKSVPGLKAISLVDGTEAAQLSLTELQEMGFSICLYAVHGLFAGLAAQTQAFAHLKTHGTLAPTGTDYAAFCDVVGVQSHQSFAYRFEDGEPE
jgi:2-methylisocitrate lyase-like PEP mutase family enzyme